MSVLSVMQHPNRTSMNKILMHMIQPNYQQKFLPGIAGESISLPPAQTQTSYTLKTREKTYSTTTQAQKSGCFLSKTGKSVARQLYSGESLPGDITQLRREFYLKEAQFKSELESLKEESRELRNIISSKEQQIQELINKCVELTALVDRYRPLYEQECVNHTQTREDLDEIRGYLTEKELEIASVKSNHEAHVRDITKTYEQTITDIIIEKDAAIQERGVRIDRLKLQLSEAFEGQSQERQQQIQELSKQLERTQQEAESLHSRLREVTNPKKLSTAYQCNDCDKQRGLVREARDALEEREKALKRLGGMCNKLQERVKTKSQLQSSQSTSYSRR